jgi:peptidoglycan/LPS O-acetylase OafA/YrhL
MKFAAQKNQKIPRLTYLPGLDGLRGISVTAVILYHAGIFWLPGGFLGVEVFFVISGYLITSLLLTEWKQTGKISFKGFWLRRAKRLLPALFALLGITFVYSAIFYPSQLRSIFEEIIAAFGYFTNWFLIFSEKSYFENAAQPPMFRHLWSLAVEEQFYIFFPLVFVVGMRLFKQKLFPLGLALAALGSAILMLVLYSPSADPSRVYYGTDTRISALLIGCILAYVWQPHWKIQDYNQRQPKLVWSLNLLGVAAFGGLLWFFFNVDQLQPFLYRGGFVLVSLLTAALIMVCAHPRTHFGKLIGIAPLRWLGTRSYSLYLWHWVVFNVTRPEVDLPLDGLPLLALRLSITLVLAELSYHLVETPFRKIAKPKPARQTNPIFRQINPSELGIATTAISITILFGVVMFTMLISPAPSRPSTSNVLPFAVSSPSFAVPPTVPPKLTATPVNLPTATPAPTVTPLPTATPVLEPTATVEPQPTAPPESTLAPDPTATPVPEPTATPLPPTAPPSPAPTVASTTNPLRVTDRKVTAFGDSVLIGASGQLRRNIDNFDMYAEVGVQVWNVISAMRSFQTSGKLGQVVVIHVGTNGYVNAGHIDEIMRIIGTERKAVFVNVKVPREWESPNNRTIAETVKKYSNAVLVDWNSASVRQPQLFAGDGYHLRPDGVNLFTGMILTKIHN